MERVKNIFATFFDVNLFSIKRLIVAAVVVVAFFILKGLLSKLIMKIFKIVGKSNAKELKNNSLYKALKVFFESLGLYIALSLLGPTEQFKATLNTLFRLDIILIATITIGNIVGPKSKFEKYLKKRLTKTNDSMVKMICKCLKIAVYTLGIVILISELGFNISGIITGLGIGGVALALAAQDTASNIIGAVMILLDKPFEIGDWITVGTTEGSVEEFTFRSTRIRESKNCVVSIPNSTIVNSPITNWSRLKKRRILINLTLEFETKLKTVADVQNDLLIYLENDPNILNDVLYVKFDEIRADGYNLRIFCYTPIVSYVDYLAYMDTLNFNIMEILNKHKTSLAYTSQTVYLRNS